MKDLQKQFIEFEEHLLNDVKPSAYFKSFADSGLFENTYPFTLLGDLMKIEQPPDHHPEGSVWEHTLMVVDLAAEARTVSDDPRVLMWSALLHDLGKASTTRIRRGRITAYDHDKLGAVLAVDFLREFTDDESFIRSVSQMVRWHMQILFVVKHLPFADVDKMLSEVPLGEIALLSLCDRLGRGEMTEQNKQREMDDLKYFLQYCQKHLDESKAMGIIPDSESSISPNTIWDK
ncbi:MAG: HDIG domain-containing metalloprotein [Deltaproteobacteria bacterium]